ncbi:S1 RNA-binding domain-containing protein [Streptomyces sp. NPDC048430]|uniref:S1 RNA-binding domain-containing protein n=1 Tax=Streptomyces sp. NPDC048430 TaxID=3155388 RepID=UPI003438533E
MAPGVLEETYVEGASRWHRLALDTVDTVRAGLAPRVRLAVWPELSSDVGAVLDTLPSEGLIECVWQDKDGRIHSGVADEEDFPALVHRASGADAAALLSINADDRVPLFTAVMPDSDGVVRARWRTEPTPSGRRWPFPPSLHRGDIVTGRVTCIASFGIYVDIGGFAALINIPELSWRHISHPSEVVSLGQEISAEILGTDLTRERVTMSRNVVEGLPPLPVQRRHELGSERDDLSRQGGQRSCGGVERVAADSGPSPCPTGGPWGGVSEPAHRRRHQ